MATNRELTAEAEALSEELGVSVELRGLNNSKLTETVERLRGMKAERAVAQPVDAPPEGVAEEMVEADEEDLEEDDAEFDTAPPAPAEVASEPATELPPLPAEHKRPTVEEWVRAGYKAEHYERGMADWETGIRRRLADGASYAEIVRHSTETVIHKPRPPQVHLVDGAGETPTGGVPPEKKTRSLYRYPYTVAEGVQIVTLRGKLPAFARIRATDLSGGKAELEQLVARGHVKRGR